MSEEKIVLVEVRLPDFGRSKSCPEIPADIYRRRWDWVLERMACDQLDILAVFADREHFANIAYLTGFDPRFEESLLLVDKSGKMKLLVGNECYGYLPDPALGIDSELFQEFSLMGQPRRNSRPLRKILSEFGIGKGVRVGCVGWKSYESWLIEGGFMASDLPAYLVDLLRDLVGRRELVANATYIFMAAENGLRLVNEPEQIAAFEYASTIVSDGLLSLLRSIRPGAREDELERNFDSCGLALSCHRMVSFGGKARRGLSSASANRARLGDAFTAAFGVAGGLSCRAGVVAHGPDDLPAETAGFFPRFAANYFDVACAWYEALKVGASAGEVYSCAERARNTDLYDFAVNPGHYIHLDEWVHSPFYQGSLVTLRSGMALQMDIIPVSNGPFCYVNAEDGVVLADEKLRGELKLRYPEMSGRIEERRRFMAGQLGIRLDESVLPLSNIAGWLPPYALDLSKAMARRR